MLQQHLQRNVHIPIPRGNKAVQYPIIRQPFVTSNARVGPFKRGQPHSEFRNLGRRCLPVSLPPASHSLSPPPPVLPPPPRFPGPSPWLFPADRAKKGKPGVKKMCNTKMTKINNNDNTQTGEKEKRGKKTGSKYSTGNQKLCGIIGTNNKQLLVVVVVVVVFSH